MKTIAITSNVLVSAQQRARSVFNRLAECVKANSCGGKNENALLEINGYCAQLDWMAKDFGEHEAYMREKVNKLRSWSTFLYSQHKHKKWDNYPEQSGAEKIHHIILSDLNVLESIFNQSKENL